MPILLDLTGRRYGLLVVVSRSENVVRGGHSKTAWHCKCDCGKSAVRIGNYLQCGKATSCGCATSDLLAKHATTHGYCSRIKGRSGEYGVWNQMIQRCYNQKQKKYASYGARGIQVCNRWRGKGGFANFIADMGPRPTDLHTLDRINNDGNYEPENCRWATKSEQARNRRSSRIIAFNGQSMTVAEWSEKTGVARHNIHARIKYGYPLEVVFSLGDLRTRRSQGATH